MKFLRRVPLPPFRKTTMSKSSCTLLPLVLIYPKLLLHMVLRWGGGQEDSDDDDKDDEPSPWRGSKAKKRQEDSSEDDEDEEDKEGEWDELIASFFGELSECDDERTSGEGGCDVDFGVDFEFFFGESTSAEENGDEKEISSDDEASPHTNTTDPPGETNSTPKMLFSVDKGLRDGLFFAGFTDERRKMWGGERSTDRC
mmetsp:Transcript_22691/g.32426  ORF Transcript_22691/g.32426 Transcript_22691/m.32426 type:complete len:199 (-) Transcript_22691:284-880(-)